MALRIICNSAYNAHTSALFAKHNIITLCNLFTIESCILMFNLIHGLLPISIQDAFTPIAAKHSYQCIRQHAGIPFKHRNNKNM